MRWPTLRQGATWTAIATTLIAGFEGVRTTTYHDTLAHGLPTVCYGETIGVKMGQKYTIDECKKMLASELPKYNAGIDKCIHVPMSPSRRAAMVSFAYNIGIAGVCKSNVVKRLNNGDPKACDGLLAYDHASGRKIPGLTRRRVAERKLCME